jgi:hypothetical protein
MYVQQVQSYDIQYSVSQVLTQGSLNAILIERLIFVALITTMARSQWGDIILIMHQYGYHPQQGRSIHSSCQLESFANDVNDKQIHMPRGL